MRGHYDVVVAGAGVAGAIAALSFARHGLSVLVVDPKLDRCRHKILCTHFVQPLAMPILDGLGLTDRIIAAGGVPTKAAFWTSAGWIDPPGDYASADGDRLYALNIERRILDPLLMECLEAEPNVDVVLARAVRNPQRLENGSYRVSVDAAGGETASVETRLLAAADGRTSPLATVLGNVHVSRLENQRAAAFGYFEGIPAPEKNRSLFYLGDREMAFLYPLGGTRALLSVYVPKEDRRAGKADERADWLVDLFRRFPDGPDYSQARLVSSVYGYRDYPNLVRRPVHEGAAFIGDAAISLDPMSGVGCSFAMKTADLLVRATANALRHGGPEEVEKGLADYTASVDAFFPAHIAGISADSIIAKSAATTAAVYGRIVRNTDLQRTFIALTGRLVTPSEFQRAYLAASIAHLKRSA